MFKSKKISIIAGAIASAITLSTFSGFAIGPTTEPFAEQLIGISNEIAPSNEQKMNDPVNVFEDFVNKEFAESSLPKRINLDEPGDYRLVGAEVSNNSENQDPNAIIVNTNDTILINGNGKYNIILDNVNIDKSTGSNTYTPISIINKADVNLKLVGKSSLKNNSKYSNGLFILQTARLTISGSGEGVSLDVFSKKSGISCGNDLTINGCTINASGIISSNLTMNGCTINATGKVHDISAGHLVINDSVITTTGCGDGISCHDAVVSDSTINATGIRAAGNYGSGCGGNLTIKDSTITATGRDCGIDCRDNLTIIGSIITTIGNEDAGIDCFNNLTITGSKITATGGIRGINCEKNLTITDSTINVTAVGPAVCCNDNLTTTNSTLNAISDESSGIDCKNDLTIDGGAVNARKILAKNNLMLKSGELVTNSINDVAWKDVVWDGGTIRKMEKVFGTFDDKGSLIDAKKTSTDGDAKCIGHLVKFNDPESNENIYLFFIGNDAIINGVNIVDKDSDEGDYKMKDGDNFVTESNRNNYNDLELFFE